MPLPLKLPEDAETVAMQKNAATLNFASMMFMLTALTLIMNWAGRGPADSWALAILGPISALLLFIVSAFTALRRTIHDTSVVAAGLVLCSFLLATWQQTELFASFVVGCLVGVATVTWGLMRNLDDRIGPLRLMAAWIAGYIAIMVAIG